MALIKINSEKVIEACEKFVENKDQYKKDRYKYIDYSHETEMEILNNIFYCERTLKNLAIYSSENSLDLYLDHNDFNPLKEYL